MILESERLILRPWKKNKADAKELYRYAKHPAVGPSAGWPVHKDVQDSLQIIRDVLSTPGLYAVVLKETGKPIGTAGITFGSTGRKELPAGDAEIGYWIGVPYWGNGYALEAVRLLLRRCFEDLDRNAVWCAWYEGNERSQKVQEKCGLHYHHTVKDSPCPLLHEVRTEHFSRITRDEWLKNEKKA